MGLWNSLKNAFTRSNTGNDAGVFDLGFGDSNASGFFSGSVQEYLEKYGANATLQMVARRTAYDVAILKWRLFERVPGLPGPNGPPRKEIFDHELLALWKRPNHCLVNFHFLYLTQLYLDVGGGEAHWVLERKPGQLKPHAIWPVPKNWVHQRPTKKDPTWRIQIGEAAMPAPLPAGEVIWLHDPDPLRPYHAGLGVVRSLDDEIEQDEWMSKFNNQFFRQGGHPGMVFGLEGVEQSVAEKIKSGYESKYAGFWNAFKTAWIGTGQRGGRITVHQLSPNHKDMDFVEGKNQKRDAMLQAFNMQRFEVGINEDVNRASAQASADGKARNVTLPRSTYLTQAVNTWLVPLFGNPKLFFECEDPRKETEEFRLAKSSEGWNGSAITRNEWRRDNGYDPLPPEKGDVFKAPLNMGMESASGRRQLLLDQLRQVDPEAAEVMRERWERNGNYQ